MYCALSYNWFYPLPSQIGREAEPDRTAADN